MTRRETRAYSHVFAHTLVNYWRVAGRLNKNPQRSAGFRVLKAPDVPSVLVELGYLSNEKDEMALTSPEWRDKASSRMAEAIEAFFAAGKVCGLRTRKTRLNPKTRIRVPEQHPEAHLDARRPSANDTAARESRHSGRVRILRQNRMKRRPDSARDRRERSGTIRSGARTADKLLTQKRRTDKRSTLSSAWGSERIC